MRALLLLITLAFIGAVGVLTALDISHHGLTGISVLAIVILVLFTVGIVGALRNPPRG